MGGASESMVAGLAFRNAADKEDSVVTNEDSAVSAVPVLLSEKLDGEKGDRVCERLGVCREESIGMNPNGESLRESGEGDPW